MVKIPYFRPKVNRAKGKSGEKVKKPGAAIDQFSQLWYNNLDILGRY
jgi:hypothetical protein